MTQPPSEGAPAQGAPAQGAPAGDVPSEAVLFEIVSGGATAEEIAALTAVLAAIAAANRQNAGPAPGPTGVSSWAERSRLVRRPVAHAPGGWRASARPR